MRNLFFLTIFSSSFLVLNGMQPSTMTSIAPSEHASDKDSIRGCFTEGDPKAVEYRESLKKNLKAIEIKVEKPFKRGDYVISPNEMSEISFLISSIKSQVQSHCSEKCAENFTAKCYVFLNFLFTSPSSERIVNIFNREQTYSREEMQSWLLQDISAYKKELEASKPGGFIIISNNETN